jgi:hypothetical protein
VPRHSSRRDNQYDIVRVLERRDELLEMRADNGNCVGLLAVKAHMPANRVPHPPPGKPPVMGDQHRPPVVGIDRHGIVVGGSGQTSSGRPALMPSLAKHYANPDVDVVVQDEAP